MKLNIRGEKLEITDSMKRYAEEKLEKLSKYVENFKEVSGTLLFKKNGKTEKIEVTIPLKNFTLRVEETGEDFYSVVDTAIDKLERQIVKNKTKLSSKKIKEKNDFILNFEYDKEENEDKIIKRKTVELKPMDEEEAILQMELLNHDFYLFKDVDTNKIALVYKRKKGDYGLIEEE